MKTLFEVINLDLAQEYTKARKRAVLKTIEMDAQTQIAATNAIEEMDIPEDDEQHHWVQKIGKAAGADLLTLGKVQPENMLAMASLGNEGFSACVKVATSSAREWNNLTIEAEKELNQESIPNTML
jgi:hypothetical protein